MKKSVSALSKRGFTLVELLVSMVILTLLVLMLASMTDATRRTWSYTTSKVEQFRGAREGFESITRKLSQATLNTYWDYDNVNTPTKYQRQSELRFISGNSAALTGSVISPTHAVFFQASLGYVSTANYSNLENLLNTWGYFIEFGSDKTSRPDFINNMANAPAEHYRFRLMELMEPSEALTLYTYTSGTNGSGAPKNATYITHEWFNTPLGLPALTRPVHVLAENIVALVILPKLSPADQTAGGYTDASLVMSGTTPALAYLYDSTGTGMTTVSDPNLNPKNQLPSVVQVTMVAVDEASFNRYQTGTAMTDFSSGLFMDATKYDADIKTLQATLQANKLSYRVFTTNVGLKAAKWSRAQKN